MTKKDDKKTIEINASLFLKVIYPDLLYDVQNKLSKTGIIFIDLNTGLAITGNINIDTLGMISKKSLKKPKNSKQNANHFLIPQEDKKIYDIEATINIYEPPSENEPSIFTIQIINENDLEFWQKIFIELGQRYIYQKPSGRICTEVFFHLVPLARPSGKDPKSAVEAIRGNIQKYQTSNNSRLDTLPGYTYPILDSEHEDEALDP